MHFPAISNLHFWGANTRGEITGKAAGIKKIYQPKGLEFLPSKGGDEKLRDFKRITDDKR